MHQAANALPKSDPLERGQILLVDDIAANRAVVSRRLQMLGHEVTCVDNGRKALQIIAANPPGIM